MRYQDAGVGPSSSPDVKQYTAAMVRVHKRLGTIGRTKDNPHFRSRYADLATICNELVGLLTEEGFSMPTYHTGWYGPEMGWCCLGVLRHDSGEWASTLVPLINLPRETKNGERPPDMQGLGSAKTYAKRYALLDLTGAWVGEEDDDGNRSTGRSLEPRSASHLSYQQDAITAISEAKSREAAKKALDTVELRVREKHVPKSVFDKCQSVFDEKWTKA